MVPALICQRWILQHILETFVLKTVIVMVNLTFAPSVGKSWEPLGTSQSMAHNSSLMIHQYCIYQDIAPIITYDSF